MGGREERTERDRDIRELEGDRDGWWEEERGVDREGGREGGG